MASSFAADLQKEDLELNGKSVDDGDNVVHSCGSK